MSVVHSPVDPALAERFYKLVLESRSFSWVGMLCGKDQYGRPLIETYLLEKASSSYGTLRDDEAVVRVSDAWDALALAVEHCCVVDLQLISANKYTPDGLREQLEKFCANTGRLELVWTEGIGSEVET